jgi:hypothetical protein
VRKILLSIFFVLFVFQIYAAHAEKWPPSIDDAESAMHKLGGMIQKGLVRIDADNTTVYVEQLEWRSRTHLEKIELTHLCMQAFSKSYKQPFLFVYDMKTHEKLAAGTMKTGEIDIKM